MTTDEQVIEPYDTTLGIIVFGHGTRDERGHKEFIAFVESLTQQLLQSRKECSWCVTYAFLEFAKPSFRQAVMDLYDKGFRKLLIVPLFLAMAGHMKQDVPALVRRAQQTFPTLDIQVFPAFGDDDAIIQGLLKRLYEATTSDDVTHCAIVLVYRGSSDVSALQQVQKVVSKLADLLSSKQIAMASMFGAGDSVDAVIAKIRDADVDEIIILPYLLFHGFLFTKLTNLVYDLDREVNTVPYTLASYLGVQEDVVKLTMQRITNFIWKVKS